jgi:hypothetical protein
MLRYEQFNLSHTSRSAFVFIHNYIVTIIFVCVKKMIKIIYMDQINIYFLKNIKNKHIVEDYKKKKSMNKVC